MAIVKIPGQLAPNGSFPVVDGNDIKGGFQIVDTIEQRNAIDASKRKIGLLCYVTTKNMYYRLRNGITNDDWDDLDLDNNGVIINNQGEAVKKDVILDIEHSHDHIHCTTLKDEHDNKYHVETNTDLVLTANNKTLTELLNYIVETIEQTNDIPVESLELENKFVIIENEKRMKLKANVFPQENTEKLVWISDNKNIATVSSDGLVTGINPGMTYIKVYSNKTRIIDTCSVIVTKSKEDNIEVIDGLLCKLDMSSEKDSSEWRDTTENNYNAELVNFDESSWTKDYLIIEDNQYIKLPNTLLSEDTCTIEIVADLLFDKDYDKIVKLFCKKNNYSEMMYQINSEKISFGSNGVVKTYEKLNHLKGLNVYGFTFNKILKTIKIFINGRMYDEITLEENQSFGAAHNSELLIASNGKNDSSSNMTINAIKIFNKELTDLEMLQDAQFLIGIYDIENSEDISKYCFSSGKWSKSTTPECLEDKRYMKSYRYTKVEPEEQYKISIIGVNFSGIADLNCYTDIKTRIDTNLKSIKFENSVATIKMSKDTQYINFYIQQANKGNIYYIIEKINEI